MLGFQHHLHQQQVASRLGERIGDLPVVRGFLLRRREVLGIGRDGIGHPSDVVRQRSRNCDLTVGCNAVARLLGELDRASGDGHRLVAIPSRRKHVPAVGERIGSDHVGTCFQVGRVHLAHDVGMRHIRHAAPRHGMHLPAETVDLGTDGAIEHDGVAAGEFVVEDHGGLPKHSCRRCLACHRTCKWPGRLPRSTEIKRWRGR